MEIKGLLEPWVKKRLGGAGRTGSLQPPSLVGETSAGAGALPRGLNQPCMWSSG